MGWAKIYLSPRNTFFKMLSFNFFKVNSHENARLDPFLNGALGMSYGSPCEGKTLGSLTQANCCTVGPFSSAFTHPLWISALVASWAMSKPPLSTPLPAHDVLPFSKEQPCWKKYRVPKNNFVGPVVKSLSPQRCFSAYHIFLGSSGLHPSKQTFSLHLDSF